MTNLPYQCKVANFSTYLNFPSRIGRHDGAISHHPHIPHGRAPSLELVKRDPQHTPTTGDVHLTQRTVGPAHCNHGSIGVPCESERPTLLLGKAPGKLETVVYKGEETNLGGGGREGGRYASVTGYLEAR